MSEYKRTLARQRDAEDEAQAQVEDEAQQYKQGGYDGSGEQG